MGNLEKLRSREVHKFDTLENWNKSDVPLIEGEVVFATTNDGKGITVKVGEDGAKTFKDIEASLASDLIVKLKAESTSMGFNVTAASATFAEIKAAYEEGRNVKVCVMLDDTDTTSIGDLTAISGDMAMFSGCFYDDIGFVKAHCDSSDTWKVGIESDSLIVRVEVYSDHISSVAEFTEIFRECKDQKIVIGRVWIDAYKDTYTFTLLNVPSNGPAVFTAIIDDKKLTLSCDVDNNWTLTETVICEVEIVNVTVAEDGTMTSDKTYGEMLEAYEDGRELVLKMRHPEGADFFAPLNIFYEGNFSFLSWDSWYNYCRISVSEEGIFDLAEYSLIREIDTSLLTDDAPPTEKAIVEYVDNQIGNIEILTTTDKSNLVAAINTLSSTVITSISNDTLILANNQEARLGELSSLVISIPDEITTLYESEFSFNSGATATTLTYPATPVIWRGDDCDENGLFIPEANINYEISVKCMGFNQDSTPIVLARVGAY